MGGAILSSVPTAVICSPGCSTQNPDLKEFKCEATGRSDIRVNCGYLPERPNDSDKGPRISLERALITFDAEHESQMHVSLTFQNHEKIVFEEARVVYIEFDDELGRNYIRRPLMSINLKSVWPGETKSFAETLLAPALRPGRYLVRLWIPSTDPAFKFDKSHNLMLNNKGVAETATGLNLIATIIVVP
jgi:hypothetical protein